MRNILRNKKADIPTTILVIGVFAMCAYALVSFYLYDSKIKKGVMETNAVEQMNSEIEKYAFYKNLGTFTDEEIGNFLGVQTEKILIPNEPGKILERKYFYVEKMDKGKRILYIKYYLP